MTVESSPALAALIVALSDVEGEAVSIAEQVPTAMLEAAVQGLVAAALALACRRRGRPMAVALVKRAADDWLARQ